MKIRDADPGGYAAGQPPLPGAGAGGYSLRHMRRSLSLAGLLLLLACRETRSQAQVPDVMPSLPLPPAAELISREGSEEALKIRFRSAASPDEVASYYRDVLSRAPWQLVSDTRTPEGTLALYAEKSDGPPLWVTIQKADGASGTFVDLAGAKTK